MEGRNRTFDQRSNSTLHHRPAHDGSGTQHRHLRLVQDRGVEEGAPAAGVGDGEGVAGVLEHRNDEALGGVHGDRQVLTAVVDDLVALDAGVDARVGLEGLAGRQGDER